MTILGVDTVTQLCEVSLKKSTGECFLKSLDEGLVHSDRLIPTINEILQDANLTVKDLTEIVVNIGPGSFTGVRVGVSFARALAQTLNLKIKKISSIDLAFFAARKKIDFEYDYLFVFLDALRGEAFGGFYTSKGEKSDDHKIYSPLEVEKILTNLLVSDKKIVVTGDGCKNFVNVFKKFPVIEEINIDKSFGLNLIELSKTNAFAALDYWEIKPFYIRKTAAEEKKIR